MVDIIGLDDLIIWIGLMTDLLLLDIIEFVSTTKEAFIVSKFQCVKLYSAAVESPRGVQNLRCIKISNALSFQALPLSIYTSPAMYLHSLLDCALFEVE